MAIESFKRYEKKFLMDEKTMEHLIQDMLEYMIPDSFNKDGKCYRISNVYYDTPSNELIRASIEQPVYKEKLRLRSYGTPAPDDLVFLEIKKKFDGVVYKRRSTFSLSEAYEFVKTGVIPKEKPYMNMQVANEIAYFLKTYELVPTTYLSYDRKAFFGKDNSDFRVTFDTNITSRREDVCLDKGSFGKKLLPENVWLMEVKIPGSVPLWFTHLLSKYKIYPARFSKYGTDYKKALVKKSTIKGEKICLHQYLPHQLRQLCPPKQPV